MSQLINGLLKTSQDYISKCNIKERENKNTSEDMKIIIDIEIEEELYVLITGKTLILADIQGFIVIKRGFKNGATVHISEVIPMKQKHSNIKIDSDNSLSNKVTSEVNTNTNMISNSQNNSANSECNIENSKDEYNYCPSLMKSPYRHGIFEHDLNKSRFKLIAYENVVFSYIRECFLPIMVEFFPFCVTVYVVDSAVKNFELCIDFSDDTFYVDSVITGGKADYDRKKSRLVWKIDELNDNIKHTLKFNEETLGSRDKQLVADVSFSVDPMEETMYDIVDVDGNRNINIKKSIRVVKYEVEME